jgi:hypothetical protein
LQRSRDTRRGSRRAEQLSATLGAEHQPANETESILVNEIAENIWRLRRMRGYEARAMDPENLDKWFNSGLLNLVARQTASAERGMHKAITALRWLQKGRGFVPSISAVDESEPDPLEIEEPFEELTWLTGPEAGFFSQDRNCESEGAMSSGFVPPHPNHNCAA